MLGDGLGAAAEEAVEAEPAPLRGGEGRNAQGRYDGCCRRDIAQGFAALRRDLFHGHGCDPGLRLGAEGLGGEIGDFAAGGDVYFDAEKAANFPAQNLLVIQPGEEIELH